MVYNQRLLIIKLLIVVKMSFQSLIKDKKDKHFLLICDDLQLFLCGSKFNNFYILDWTKNLMTLTQALRDGDSRVSLVSFFCLFVL